MNKSLTINLKINVMYYTTNIYYIMHHMTNILTLVYVEVTFS